MSTPIGTPVFISVGGDVSSATVVTSGSTSSQTVSEIAEIANKAVVSGGDVSSSSVSYIPSGATVSSTVTLAEVGKNAADALTNAATAQSDVDTNTTAIATLTSEQKATTQKINDVFISVADYGATGSSESTTGTITASSTSLTVADASDFSVGQSISIAGAGNATAGAIDNTGYFVSTISAISGNVITLADAAVTAVSGALVQHDDRDAIQSAINAAFDAGGGVVFFPSGVYNLAGPFYSDSYSLLKIPNNQPDAEPISITLRGAINGSTAYAEMYSGAIPKNGVLINSLAVSTGQSWALLNGTSGNLAWSLVTLNIEAMTFRIPTSTIGPVCQGLFLGNVANVNIVNVTVDTDVEGVDLPQPTSYNGYGILLPAANNYGNIVCRNVYVTGFFVGIRHSEHAILDGVFIQQCANAIECDAGYHNAVYVRVLMQECPNLIVGAGELPIYGVLDVETYSVDSSKWYTQASIVTGTGKIKGTLTYTCTAAGVGYSDLTGFSNNSANLKFISENGIAQPASTVTVGDSPYSYTPSIAGTVAVSGGTVTDISITRKGTSIPTGITSGLIPVASNDTVVVTYTTAPTMNFLP